MSRRSKQPSQSAQQIIRRRREKALVRRGYVGLALRVAGLILLGWVVLTQFLLITQAGDNQMYPAIKAGDLVIAWRLEGDYGKSDVVVYTTSGQQKIGRVVAREGDVVNMDESGYLLVNGTRQTDDILFSTYGGSNQEIVYPYTVPEGCVFVLGDYRTAATDSRDYGAIPLTDVQGKVITILRRRDL